MSTRKPAAARSSSDSPPQKPYSRCSRAQARQSTSASQERHTARACASRVARASGRSPAGAKNSLDSPRQDASSAHCNGPLKTRLVTDSAAIINLLSAGCRWTGLASAEPETELGRRPGGRPGSSSSSPYRVSEPDHKAICQRRSRDTIYLPERWISEDREGAPVGPAT